MTIADDLILWIKADPVISANAGDNVSHAKIPQKVGDNRVWLARATTEQEEALNDLGAGPFRQVFDVECYSSDLTTAEGMAEALLNKSPIVASAYGDFGTGAAQGIFISDQQDDYIPRGVGSDKGSFVFSVNVEIVGYKEAP